MSLSKKGAYLTIKGHFFWDTLYVFQKILKLTLHQGWQILWWLDKNFWFHTRESHQRVWKFFKKIATSLSGYTPCSWFWILPESYLYSKDDITSCSQNCPIWKSKMDRIYRISNWTVPESFGVNSCQSECSVVLLQKHTHRHESSGTIHYFLRFCFWGNWGFYRGVKFAVL